jgi:hypothetical protein
VLTAMGGFGVEQSSNFKFIPGLSHRFVERFMLCGHITNTLQNEIAYAVLKTVPK